MPKLRLIAEAYNQIKLDDPDSAITKCGLRRMVKAGEIPVVKIGRKSLINYDLLMHYLHTGKYPTDLVKPNVIGEIRKIS